MTNPKFPQNQEQKIQSNHELLAGTVDYPGPNTPEWVGDDHSSAMYKMDALKLMTSMRDSSIDCVWTDPPYLLSNGGTTCVAGMRVPVDKGSWDHSQDLDSDHQFNLSWLAQCRRILKPAGTIWVTGTVHNYISVGMAMRQLGFRILNDIIWEKTNPPPNLGCRCFTHSTETLLWATKAPKDSSHRYIFNYAAMKEENGGKQMKTVWKFPAPGKDEKVFGKHPTQKPLALIKRCLRASTNAGDLVLDPFAGSGSTGIAAMQMGRRFLLCEQNDGYVRLAADRLKAFQTEPPPCLSP